MTPAEVMDAITEALERINFDQEVEIDFQYGSGTETYPYAFKVYVWEKGEGE